MTRPTIFISHRHADKAIAQVIAEFLHERSSGGASIFCSSSVDFRRPVPGDSLELSLKQALASTDVVVLVFTIDREDWSYCMWECGVATDPEDKRPTKVVVLQCGDAPPKPYVDHVRVDLRSLDSVTGFVKTMLTSTDYFPALGQPLTGFSAEDRQIKGIAAELHAELADVLAGLRQGDVEERPASTYLRFELDRESVAQLCALGDGTDDERDAEIVRTHSRVVDKRGARSLFKFRVDDKMTLGRIVDEWAAQVREAGDRQPDVSPPWFRSLADQIAAVVRGRFPVVRWTPFSVEPSRAIIPYVSGSRTVPASGGIELHTYFVPMSPRPISVAERMIVLESMFHKNLAETPGATIRLAVLLAEMKADGRSRVPMLGERGCPKFIVHRSMIQEFVSERAFSGDVDVRALTVHDLLVDAENAAIFRQTFAVVDRSADMDQALAAMNAIPDCQDVFVTTDGTPSGAVIGWLTNSMFMS